MGMNPQPSERKIKYGEEERIKMSRLRQTISKRLNNIIRYAIGNAKIMPSILSKRPPWPGIILPVSLIFDDLLK